MVNEQKRRQMIWLIKRASSLTAWQRFEASFLKFVAAFEAELQRSPNPDVEGYKQVLDAQIDLEQGLAKLTRGDKSVFQYRNEFDGYLSDLASVFDRMFGVAFGLNPEMGYDYSNFDELDRLWCELKWPKRGFTRDQVRANGVEYAYARFEMLNDPESFGPFNFPSDLAAPVEPEHAVLVASHEAVPEYGIWEPVDVLSGPIVAPEHEARLNEWIKKTGHPPPDVPVKYKLDLIGSPSYLLQGVPAPTCYLESNDRPINYHTDKPVPVTWRLLWQDDRYVDGTIPEEEKLYFALADEDQQSKPAKPLRALPGETCPESGTWVVAYTPSSARHFNKGDVMPELNLPNGETIWTLAE